MTRIACLCVTMLFAATIAAADKPNIIFILADDLGYGDLGCYGQKIIQTPCLDRMAAEGLRFTQFYAGSTVCAPSRSVLMTGLHTGHTRVRGNAGPEDSGAQMLRDEDVTVAEVLRSADYATGLVGKWGLGMPGDQGIPNRQGFDSFYGYLSQHHAHNHFPDFLWQNEEQAPLPNVVTPVGTAGGGYATERVQYAGDLFADEALAFVARHRDRPFFLYLALVVPHANNERSRVLGDGQEVPDYGPYADRDWHSSLKGQAAMITRMDRQIGELLAKLAELGIDQRTLVIFTSDNGPHKEGGPQYDPEFFQASGPLRGIKRSLTDGGIRVPFIARWPGKIQPGVSKHVGYFGDFLATAAELAGVQPPPDLDSISFVPTLLGRVAEQAEHEYLYWEFYERGISQAVLLEGRWKGIRLKSLAAPLELYDLHHDLGEQQDVAAEHPERVARIGRIMETARVDNEFWKLPLR
jgi:arylsulfatase A-like enzyme